MHIDMEPMGTPQKDHEGAMAKADLYKIANYSLKLFKQLDGSQQLEGWVQAKITKAADYIASVYHYMEYEMKFSEYGQAIEDSDVYTLEQKQALKAKLQEAKSMVKQLKAAQAEKIMEATGFRAGDKKKGKVEKSEKKQYFVKLTKDNKTKGLTTVADEGESQGEVRDRVKRDNPGWNVESIRLKDTGSGETVSEAKKDKKANKDYDGDGKVETGKDEYLGSKIAAAKKAGKLKESTKCTECGMVMEKCKCDDKVDEGSTGDYSAKKARAGKDIGKPGKNFAKIATKAEKGGAKSGEAVAGAVLKKLRAKG